MSKQLSIQNQKGAAMVEMALTLSLMILILMAIVEFALATFMWTRAVEATRAGARYAIVNSPVEDLSTLGTCSSDTTTQVIPTCDASNCAGLINEMQRILPAIQAENITLVYECSRVGNPEYIIPSPEVRVSLRGLSYEFIVPQIIGLGASIELPPFSSTRTGEDLHTVPSSNP